MFKSVQRLQSLIQLRVPKLMIQIYIASTIVESFYLKVSLVTISSDALSVKILGRVCAVW